MAAIDKSTPTSRVQARLLGLTQYFTNRPCKYGHIAKRTVHRGVCVECKNEWRRKRRDKIGRLSDAAYRDRTRERRKQYVAASRDIWAKQGKRRLVAIKLATPIWADLDKIDELHAERAKRTEETGIPHHVDHIIPIVNKRVCGLHVSWNLQIITAKENYSKYNLFCSE